MDKKFIIGVLVFTAVILVGTVVLVGNLQGGRGLERNPGAKLTTFETSFDFKDISYSGGNVEHAFKIKNEGTSNLVIANLSTSCMCTTAYLKAPKEKGPTFGMKGHTPASNWKGVLKPGEEGEIVTIFDPAAHGPAGIGPTERMISFETNDTDHPYVELSFKAVVVK